MLDPTQDGEAATEAKRYYGKYPAIVLKPDDDKDPDIGRVKVQIPAFLEAAPKQTAGATPGAYRPIEVVALPCFPPGFFFVPEEGDNVWVEFAAGDIDFPIWTGVWYPDGKLPKTAKNQSPKAAQKVIRTKVGHVIEIDDNKDAEKITIKHGKGTSALLLEEKKITLSVGQASLVLDEQAGITLSFGSAPTAIKLEMVSGGTTLSSANGLSSGPIALSSAMDALIKVLFTHVHGPPGSPSPALVPLQTAPPFLPPSPSLWKSK